MSKSFFDNDTGSTIIEYALIAGLMALGIYFSLSYLTKYATIDYFKGVHQIESPQTHCNPYTDLHRCESDSFNWMTRN